ncbi:hypothetical protein [Mesorhizobium shangrilense]|uniref:Uncharacterized protein n=1 Tax=Mesorhizobium shangrilense TaxID=460060 RepID=A0ABV2DLD0_9HYPH
MKSEFSAARVHLERAYDALRGDDETSSKTREALDLLIEAVAAAEYSRPSATVIDLPIRAKNPSPPQIPQKSPAGLSPRGTLGGIREDREGKRSGR